VNGPVARAAFDGYIDRFWSWVVRVGLEDDSRWVMCEIRWSPGDADPWGGGNEACLIGRTGNLVCQRQDAKLKLK
jgi:hypothetical protein